MLFKPKNEIVYSRLHDEIDYEDLSLKYTTSVPGFRKGDVVREYNSIYYE